MAGPGISGGPIAVVERQLEALSPRDRKLLVGLYTCMGVVGVAFLWWTLHGLLDDKASRVMSAKTTLQQVQILQARYGAAAEEVKRQESRLQQYAGQKVSAYIEEVASRRGVLQELRSVNETGAEQVGNLRQSHHKVELKRISYESAFGFIYELETAGYPTRIDQASFRTVKTKDGKVIDLTLDMVVYSLAEG